MAVTAENLKGSMNVMTGEKGIGLVFVFQLVVAIFLYYVAGIIGWNGTYYFHSGGGAIQEDMYPLFSLSFIVLMGVISIFIILFTGSMVQSSLNGERKSIGYHFSRSIHRLPYGTVSFLFPWMFTLGIPIILMLAFRKADDVCFFIMMYYIVVWLLLAKLFFSPYLILQGKNINKSVTMSWDMTSGVVAELGIITGIFSMAAYISFFIALSLKDDPSVAIIFLAIFALLMTYTYVFIAHMYFVGSRTSRKAFSPGVLSASSPFVAPYPSVLLLGFTEEEVKKIRKKGIPATALATWARRATLFDIISRPPVYEGDCTWYPRKVAVFSGVSPGDMVLLMDRMKSAIGEDIIFTSITPLNSGYVLDGFLDTTIREAAFHENVKRDAEKDESNEGKV